MTFFSILCALLIEQIKPMRANNRIYSEIKRLATGIERWCNAGHVRHGRFGWFLVLAMLLVPVVLIDWFLARLSPLAELVWNVLIVYVTLGFRRYSHHFTSIQMALAAGDEVTARKQLAEWAKIDTVGMETPEIIRIAIEHALLASHRNVFGVFLWLLLPLGPAGAVLYRVAEYLSRAWNEPDHMKNEAFGRFAASAFYWIDWVPARLTAIAFAIVGNFEDAVYAWRNFSSRWQDEAMGIILATGGGAMGVRLGNPAERAISILPVDAAVVDSYAAEPEIQPGEEPTFRSLQSTVGLVWRALLLWMLMLLLFSIAVWLG